MCGVYAYARIWQAYRYDNRGGPGLEMEASRAGTKSHRLFPGSRSFQDQTLNYMKLGTEGGGVTFHYILI